MIPLLISTIIKGCPLKESYILPYDIFCQPISYVTESSTLLFFFTCLIEHTSRHMNDFFVMVFLFFHSEEPPQPPNLSLAILPCLHMLQFCKCFF